MKVKRKNSLYHGSTKRSKSYKQALEICKSSNIAPDVMQVQLPYYQSTNLTGGGIADLEVNVFRLNSAFDPDFSGVGAQPLGFDQWAALYGDYRVVGSKIEVKAFADSASNNSVAVIPMTTNAALTVRDQYLEQNYCEKQSLGNDTQHGVATINSYMPVSKIHGGPKDIVYYDDALRSAVTTNPTKQFYWHVVGYAMGAGSTNFDIVAETKIIYYIQFLNRKTLVRS